MTLSMEEGRAGEKWEKINNEDGVEVFSKDIKDALSTLKESLILLMEKIMWVLKDDKRRKDWVARYLKVHA